MHSERSESRQLMTLFKGPPLLKLESTSTKVLVLLVLVLLVLVLLVLAPLVLVLLVLVLI